VNEDFVCHVMQESVRGKIYFKGHKRLDNAKASIILFLQKIRKSKKMVYLHWVVVFCVTDGRYVY